jgi:hypothetical protein
MIRTENEGVRIEKSASYPFVTTLTLLSSRLIGLAGLRREFRKS